MLKTGEIIDDKYKILSVIGRGGMSTVYKALNIRVGNYWAIKEFTQKGILQKEVFVLGRLKHKGLPIIADVINLNNQWYLIEEFIEGISLSDIVKMKEPAIDDILIDWTLQLCHILKHLHTQRPEPIIYQDMKPSNVIVGHDGIIKLVDFGISTLKHGENEKSGLGTRGYAAPEQYKKSQGIIDARTDVYGLGATLYHLVTGSRPKGIHTEDFKLLKNAKSSNSLKRVIEKSLQSCPDNRYQDISSLMDDLKNSNTLGLGEKRNVIKLLINNPLKKIGLEIIEK